MALEFLSFAIKFIPDFKKQELSRFNRLLLFIKFWRFVYQILKTSWRSEIFSYSKKKSNLYIFVQNSVHNVKRLFSQNFIIECCPSTRTLVELWFLSSIPVSDLDNSYNINTFMIRSLTKIWRSIWRKVFHAQLICWIWIIVFLYFLFITWSW